MHAIEVGKLYAPGRNRWPEFAQINWDVNGLELTLFFPSPTPREVEAARRGAAEFALKVEGPIVFFLYHFAPAIPWSDALFSWHLVPEDRRQPPLVLAGDERAVLQVVLVDANTGLVQSYRVVTLATDFSRALFTAIAEQAATAWCGREEYDRQQVIAYARWPTSELLLAQATHRTIGGA